MSRLPESAPRPRLALRLLWTLVAALLLTAPLLGLPPVAQDLLARWAIFLPILSGLAMLSRSTPLVALAAPVFVWLGAWGAALGPIHFGAAGWAVAAGAALGIATAVLLARLFWRANAAGGARAGAAIGLGGLLAALVLAPNLATLTGAEAGGLPLAPPTAVATGLGLPILPPLSLPLPEVILNLWPSGPDEVATAGGRLDGVATLYFAAVLPALLLTLLLRRLAITPFGAALHGIEAAPHQAEAAGIAPARLRGRAVALVAGAIAAAGALLALWQGRADPNAVLSLELLLWLAIGLLIGGTGRPAGALFGAVVVALGTAPAIGLAITDRLAAALPAPLAPLISGAHAPLWLGVILLAVALAFPGGVGGALSRRPRPVGQPPRG